MLIDDVKGSGSRVAAREHVNELMKVPLDDEGFERYKAEKERERLTAIADAETIAQEETSGWIDG